jgi:hypothetical protein
VPGGGGGVRCGGSMSTRHYDAGGLSGDGVFVVKYTARLAGCYTFSVDIRGAPASAEDGAEVNPGCSPAARDSAGVVPSSGKSPGVMRELTLVVKAGAARGRHSKSAGAGLDATNGFFRNNQVSDRLSGVGQPLSDSCSS